MKSRLLLAILFAGFSLALTAQNISVKDFYYAENDLTARYHGTSVEDQNGNVCALIKVETTEKGLWFFDVGALGVTKTEMQNASHPAEIWVYVPFSVTWITIQHERLGKLSQYRFPCSIDKGCTYVMKLITGKVETIVTPSVNTQFLLFTLYPKDALLTVDGEPWLVTDGTAQKMVDFGQHEYRVEAADFHTEVGRVVVNDPDNLVEQEIRLKSAVGFLKLEGDKALLSRSTIHIDNANGADALQQARKLKSGEHKVRVVHAKYKAFERTVTIKDGETTTLKVDLDVNFSTVTLKVDADAEIYVNNEYKGVRTWTGDLEAGTYVMEARMKNHRSVPEQKVITENMSGQTILLETPKAITGTLTVTTIPPKAMLYIDGKEVGETPRRINTIPIGEHSVRLKKDGYTPLQKAITIEEGETLVLEEQLEALPEPKAKDKPKKEEKPKSEAKPKVEKPQASIPSTWFATLNFAYDPSPQTSFGFTVGSVKKFGWFFSAMSNFGFKAMEYNYTADVDGYVDGNYPAYSGESCSTRISVIGGAMMKVANPLYLRAGVGYGMRVKSWYTGDVGLVKMSNDSWIGVDASLGAQAHLKGFVLSFDVVSTNFKNMELKAGMGYSW